MSDHNGLVGEYRRVRDVRFRLGNRIVQTIPPSTLETCGRILGMLRNGVLSLETEDESSLLMDYCLYYPAPDGGNLVTKYLQDSAPPAGSEELAALQSMTQAYYSLFEIVDVEPGIGVSVYDLFRDEEGFIVDLGLGKSAQRSMMLATRIVPMEGALTTGGAAVPVDLTAAQRILADLVRAKRDPSSLDFNQITPRQEAEVAAQIIRACRVTGMTSRIGYVPAGKAVGSRIGGKFVRRVGRNDRCPCGSGKKFKSCCSPS